MLSLLPRGASLEIWCQFEHRVPDICSTLRRVMALALAERRETDNALYLHPVISAYISQYHPILQWTAACDALCGVYVDYATAHYSDFNTLKFKEDAVAMAVEDPNIRSILLYFSPSFPRRTALI